MHDTVPITTTSQRVRSPRDISESASRVPCGHCWIAPGSACATAPPGYHLARYLRAERRGFITRAELAAVVATLDVIAVHVTIPDVTP